MIKDLTNSKIERQNILNNELAIEEVRKNTKINGISFENKLVLTKNVVADFFEVDIRTINRYLTENGEELKLNGYDFKMRFSPAAFISWTRFSNTGCT